MVGGVGSTLTTGNSVNHLTGCPSTGVCATPCGGVIGKTMGCEGVGFSMGIGLGFFVSTYVGLREGSSVGSYVGGSSDGKGVGYLVGVGMVFLVRVTVGLG